MVNNRALIRVSTLRGFKISTFSRFDEMPGEFGSSAPLWGLPLPALIPKLHLPSRSRRGRYGLSCGPVRWRFKFLITSWALGNLSLISFVLGRKCEFPRNLRTGPISPRG